MNCNDIKYDDVLILDDGFSNHREINTNDILGRLGRHTKSLTTIGGYSGGIYFLWYNDDVVYVGQTKNIRNRLSVHEYDHPNWKWTHLSFIEEKNQAERLIVEKMFIGFFHPKYNINGNDKSCIDN